MKGGAEDNSGRVTASGKIGRAFIGSIEGGSGANSGVLSGTPETGGSIGTVTVFGDVVGSSGASSGAIFSAKHITSVTIDGNLKGGTGAGSGTVHANGNITTVKVLGDVVGDSGSSSGSIFSAMNMTSVTTDGSLKGGTGAGSGTISANGNITTVKVLGDVVGNSGSSSGSIFSAMNMTSVTTDGSLKGGTGTGSGSIGANGKITKVVVGEDIIGGNSTATAFLSQSGFISATLLTSVTVGGDIKAGKNGGGGIASSGAIRADVIGSLVVKGSLIGDDTVGALNPVVIGAAGLTNPLAIKSVSIGGNVDLAEILAGYNTATTATNFRGTPVNGDASIGTVVIEGTARELNIVAGGKLGGATDTRFGTANNVVIPAAFGVSNNNPLIFSKIASVVINGGLAAEKNPNDYGIVAQSIGKIKIGAMPIPLQSGPYNDRSPINLGTDATFNFRAVELAIA